MHCSDFLNFQISPNMVLSPYCSDPTDSQRAPVLLWPSNPVLLRFPKDEAQPLYSSDTDASQYAPVLF